MSEVKDAALDAVEGLAAAGLDHLGLALAPVAAELLPIGAKQVVAVAVAAYRQRKAKVFWSNAMTRGETVSQFVDWVNARLAADPDRVTTSFAEGARAAADKADLAVVPSIALLTRRYAAGEFPKWFFRGALGLLVDLGALEFGRMRDLIQQLRPLVSDKDGLTLTNAKGPFVAITRGDSGADGGKRENRLDFSDDVPRFLRLLKQNGLGHESGGYGIGGSPGAMVIDTETVAGLAGIMPLDS